MPRVSVVIASHNRRDRLRRLLEALGRQTMDSADFEVIVIDDASDFEVDAMLRELSGELEFSLKWHVRQRSGGPAVARNMGWRMATTPFIAFTDDDCEPTPAWLAELTDASDGESQIVQGKTLPNPAETDASGPFSRSLSSTELGPWYPTCNMGYPRSLLERLNGFDEAYPLPGGEDTDLAWRAFEEGASSVLASGALVHHAVQYLGPAGRLRVAARWSPAVRVFRRHPRLKDQLLYGVFWKRSHALLLTGLAGLIAGRRAPLAVGLVIPYAKHLRARMHAEHGSPIVLPYYAVHDAVEVAAMIRGGLAARTLIL